MTAQIPDEFKDLLERPIYATVATVMPSGQPQLTEVWCNYDGEHVLINTARNRQKAKNLSDRPMVTLMLVDPDNPYRWMEIRGTIELIEEGAQDHIDDLARKYANVSQYYGGWSPAELEGKETRVTGKITPVKVNAFNPPVRLHLLKK
ncbi:MAG: PPOX class F420-dependent oxidoreductase [Anaerolineae bacterium]|nr:PPOX class F420-dependent oxidoreductase [Anaerolineae bacterium]MCB0227233.1 PPOX class F420-dependent oxidoreductase [Anaerolineae bacterium]